MKLARISSALLALLVTGASTWAQDGSLPLGNPPIKVGTTKATATHKPYPGDWYPVTSRSMVDALTKFSSYLGAKHGTNPMLGEIEMYRHYVGEGSPIAPKYDAMGYTDRGWWGHCNGYTAAALQHRAPWLRGRTVTINGQKFKFSQDDLKANLAEAFYHTDALSKGTRSNLSNEQYSQAKKLMENGTVEGWRTWWKDVFKYEAPAEYNQSTFKGIADRMVLRFEDMRPADFHRGLLTVIGKAKVPIAIEVAAGTEVWNYPAYKFETTVVDGGRMTPGGTNKLVDVTTTVTFEGTGVKTYTYELELDMNNRVVGGGKWTGDSVLKHPDFIWLPKNPQYMLNDIMAEAFATNIRLDIHNIKTETFSAADITKIVGSTREVAMKIAPIDPASTKTPDIQRAEFSAKMERTVETLAKDWNRLEWMRQGYGSFDQMVEQALATMLRNNGFNVDLYKELQELLPKKNRAIDNAEERVRVAAESGQAEQPMTFGQKVKAEAATQLVNAGMFAGAFVVKEGMVAMIDKRDPQHFWNSFQAFREPMFYGGLAAFTAASTVTQRALSTTVVQRALAGAPKLNFLAHAGLPLAAGMAATQVLTGQASVESVARATGAFMAVGYGMHALTAPIDAAVMPALMSAGVPGKIGAIGYAIGKMAVTLYLGEKLDHYMAEGIDRLRHHVTKPSIVSQAASTGIGAGVSTLPSMLRNVRLKQAQ